MLKLWSDLIKEMNECVEKYLSIQYTFLFMGRAYCKENTEDRVKLLESNVLKLLSKDNNGGFA